MLTASEDKKARVWDVATGQALLTLEGHTTRDMGCAWSDSSKVLTASEDKTARVWDVATLQHTQWAAQK